MRNLYFPGFLARGMLAILASAVLAAGCASNRPVVYPSTWPFAQLKAPPGSFQAELPQALRTSQDPHWINGAVFNPESQWSGRYWAVAFTSKLDWQGLNAQLDQQLKPLGYMLSRRGKDAPDDELLTTEYVKPDCTQIISIIAYPGVYVLKINIYDHPLDRQMEVFSRMQPIP